MTAQDVAWEAYRPQAAEHDVTPCRLAFDAGWSAAADHIRRLALEHSAHYDCDPAWGTPFADLLKDPS